MIFTPQVQCITTEEETAYHVITSSIDSFMANIPCYCDLRLDDTAQNTSDSAKTTSLLKWKPQRKIKSPSNRKTDLATTP